ncbi:MAG: hypothetical protein JSS61_02705 [Verrucomicrobia bacterium]|nr:hypothetical protein [Verrucomicrobiota bacterium]
MSVHAVAQSLMQYVPSQEQISEKFSTFVPNGAQNLSKFAVPIIATIALSSFNGVSAGPASYATCVASCLALATPALTPACLVGCVALAGPWCP